MQQLREAYKALQEAELVKGREAAARQAQLAAQGKPLAVQAVRRVERIGGFEPPNETEDITARVARELAGGPKAETNRGPKTETNPRSRKPKEGYSYNPTLRRSEAAGRAQAEQIAAELAAERAARLKAAKEKMGSLGEDVRPISEEGRPGAHRETVANLKDMIARGHNDPHITFFGAQMAHNATKQLMDMGKEHKGDPNHYFGDLKPFVLRKPWIDEGTTIDEENDPKNLPMDVLRHHAATKANEGKPLTPEQRKLARQHVLMKAAEEAKKIN